MARLRKGSIFKIQFKTVYQNASQSQTKLLFIKKIIHRLKFYQITLFFIKQNQENSVISTIISPLT